MKMLTVVMMIIWSGVGITAILALVYAIAYMHVKGLSEGYIEPKKKQRS
jgi:hypothetical protein